MADFASYREKDTDAPNVINLDHVGYIEVADNRVPGVHGEAYIVFSKFVEAQRQDDGQGDYRLSQPSGELTTWRFPAALTDSSLDEVIKRRDKVLAKLLSGKRTFVFLKTK